MKNPKLARSFKKNNARRVELIRKEIQGGGIDLEERQELAALEEWVEEWVDKRDPVPMDYVRKLWEKLKADTGEVKG